MNRFEAVFYEGEEDRWPTWDVVEWTKVTATGKSGRKIQTFSGNSIGQRQAEQLALKLNQALVSSATDA